ncbi:hypothetical protein L1887_55820 [Cichorium endivia]|nr:hypothetical protein L1887_55820 [Cichorium endivia]
MPSGDKESIPEHQRASVISWRQAESLTSSSAKYSSDRMKVVGWTLPSRKCQEAQEEAGSACGVLLHACGKCGPSLFAQEDRLKASSLSIQAASWNHNKLGNV